MHIHRIRAGRKLVTNRFHFIKLTRVASTIKIGQEIESQIRQLLWW